MKSKTLAVDILNIFPRKISEIISKLIIRLTKKRFFKELDELNKLYPTKILDRSIHFNRILIIRLDALGDMVWTTAFIREIRRNYPDALIDIVARKGITSLLETCPYIDNIFSYDCDAIGDVINNNYKDIEKRAEKFASKFLIPNNYDVVFLPREIYCDTGYDNIALAFLSGAKYRLARGISYNHLQSARSFFTKKYFSEFLTVEKPRHEVDQILDLIRCLDGSIENNRMEVWESKKSKEQAMELLFEAGLKEKGIHIVVGISGSSASRAWPIENYIELFQQITNAYGDKISFIICGGSELNQYADKFVGNNIINIVGKTDLLQLVSVIKYSDMYLGADTGIMQIAAASGKPIVEISAHLKDDKYCRQGHATLSGPWQVPAIVIEPEHGLDSCVGTCEMTYPHCIKQVKVKEVFDALDNILTSVIVKLN